MYLAHLYQSTRRRVQEDRSLGSPQNDARTSEGPVEIPYDVVSKCSKMGEFRLSPLYV
jgi:hypothetical protein